MKRRELYEMVWHKPLRTLGPALGMSDVGLAKLCKRHQIPVPPVGYWAKVAAGQHPPRVPLPNAHVESTINLPTLDDAMDHRAQRQFRQRLAQAAGARQAVPVQNVEIRSTLDGCHAAVARTARFFAGIQPAIAKANKAAARAAALREPNFSWFDRPRTTFGRYTSDADGCLRVAATLRHIDWILRFHDALLRALLSNGCRVRARHENQSRWFEVAREGEAARLSFAEEYDKVLPDKSRATISVSPSLIEESPFRPRDTFKLKLEREIGGLKQWVGSSIELEKRLPEIARDIPTLLQVQGAQREIIDAERKVQQRLDEQRAAARQAIAAAQHALAQRKAARAAQVDRAFATAKALDDHAAVLRLLDSLDIHIGQDKSGATIRTWIELIRSMLAHPLAALVAGICSEVSDTERPLWWPGGSAYGGDRGSTNDGRSVKDPGG